MSDGVASPDSDSIADSVPIILEIAGSRAEWIILFGSYSREEQRIDSDIDLCVYLEAEEKERFHLRAEIIGKLGDRFDVQTYQDLPLTVRMEVLKGRVLYCSDPVKMNDVAYNTIKDYNLFESSYKLFLGAGDV